MLDQTVTFEDVSAETIAMEFVQFEDVDADTLAMEHFDDMKTELCMDSVWSIWEAAALSADDLLFQDRQYRVVYNHVRHDATTEEIWADVKDGGNRADAQVSMFAPSGSIKHLWFAADSCIKQSGTHHSYIEDFEMQDDGSLELVTGS
jgi:hypothetical protein